MLQLNTSKPLYLKLSKEETISYRSLKNLYKINYIKLLFLLALPFSFITFVILIQYIIKDNFLLSCILFPFLVIINGFWLHNYSLLIHEAAHQNLHKNNRINDLISNIFIMPFTGLEVKNYRKSHWNHHLYLGRDEDTEISYRNKLSLKSIIKEMLGFYLITSLIRYNKNYKRIEPNKGTILSLFIPVIYMIFFQFLIASLLYYYISFLSCLSWLISFFILSPFFSRLRQTIEHRPLDTEQYDGTSAENVMFGEDFFSRSFGGMGFNNHLIHHFDPRVPCTNLTIARKFLSNSSIGIYIELNSTSYLQRLIKLIK